MNIDGGFMDVSQYASAVVMQRRAAECLMDNRHDTFAEMFLSKDNATKSAAYSAMIAMFDISKATRMAVLVALYEMVSRLEPELIIELASFFLEFAMLLDRDVVKMPNDKSK
jgi:hypothetical protein